MYIDLENGFIFPQQFFGSWGVLFVPQGTQQPIQLLSFASELSNFWQTPAQQKILNKVWLRIRNFWIWRLERSASASTKTNHNINNQFKIWRTHRINNEINEFLFPLLIFITIFLLDFLIKRYSKFFEKHSDD